MVDEAARVAGITLSPEAEKRIADSLSRKGGLLANYKSLREMKLGNDTPPAVVFNPLLPGMRPPQARDVFKYTQPKAARPKTDEDLAYLPVTHLAQLVRSRAVSSTDLTKLYLARLKKYDPVLHCVVTLTEELALKQAAKADAEIKAGQVPRPAARHPLGSQGPSGGQGL